MNLDWECVEFVIAGWSKVEFYDFMIRSWSKQWEILLMVISKYCLWQLDSCWRGLKLRKLVTKDRVHMSPERASGEGGRVGDSWNCIFFFWESLLGGVNVGKWGDRQEKKFFIDNAVQALIPFQVGHQALLKLYVHSEEGISVCEKGKNFLWSGKITLGRLFRIYWNFVYLLALQKKVGGF